MTAQTNDLRTPSVGEYVHVTYAGGFSRTGNVVVIDPAKGEAFVEFHYSNVPSEWVGWTRLSYNKTALRETP